MSRWLFTFYVLIFEAAILSWPKASVADMIAVSSTTATPIISSVLFGKHSISLESPTTNQIYLLNTTGSTTTFVNSGYVLTQSTLTINDLSGAIYGCAPKANQATVPVYYIGGQ